MTQPADVATIQALEAQLRELTMALARLETARRTLAPIVGESIGWRGAARRMYDEALGRLESDVEAGIAAVRVARDRTAGALAHVSAHG